MSEQTREKDLYPIVERWMKERFKCFVTAADRGLSHGRIDVIGVRDIGGDLSGEIETIAVEVKRGSSPFVNASGQTVGYRIYANRVYLADEREKSFSQDEMYIASHLGIGLIEISEGKCTEVLSGPFYTPIKKLHMLLLENLKLGRCQICESVFQIGNDKSAFSNVTRENLKKAVSSEKGLMFWNREVAKRKRELGIRDTPANVETYERRFVCPDCIAGFFSQFMSE
jgi:hypothetical protein